MTKYFCDFCKKEIDIHDLKVISIPSAKYYASLNYEVCPECITLEKDIIDTILNYNKKKEEDYQIFINQLIKLYSEEKVNAE